MKRILALDQSSKISGYSIFQGEELIAYGKFTFDDDDLNVRLLKIRNKVKQLIEEQSIDELKIEDIQLQNNVGNNVQTFKALAEVYGVVMELAQELEIPCESVLSTVWKSRFGIKGRARADQKKAAQQYVLDTFGIKPTQDECDAICIGNYFASQPKKISWG